jgi:two-component system, cell cycle sensor histidine kinase and response regulator CckA
MSHKPVTMPRLDLAQLQLLYDLAEAVSRADDPNEIYRAAVDGLAGAIADRASVMVFDADGVMRFKASKGISARHRSVMEAKLTWQRGDRDATAVTIPDVTQEPSVSAFLPTLEQEGIRAIALIPLMGNGGLIGKFVLYYDKPHEFRAQELRLARTVATHVAFAAERQLAATTLRESQERYREVFNNAAEGIFLVDVTSDGRFKFVEFNPVIESVTGLSNCDVSGRFVEDVLPEPRATAVIANYRRCLQAETGIAYEEKLRLPMGRRHFHVQLSPVRNGDGRVYRIVGVARDITDRHAAEEALRNAEQRLRMVQNAAHLAGYSRDLATNEVTTFGEYAELYGLNADQIPRTFDEFVRLIHPDDRDRVKALLKDSREGGHDFDIEFRTCWPDGSIHWICGRGGVYRDDSGQPVRTAGVNFDVTERKNAEAALRESEERFRRVFEEGPLGLALIGRDYCFLKANSALCQMVGYSEAELIQKSIADITHPDDLQADVQLSEQLFRGEIPFFRLQKRYLRKSGEVLWINLTASVVRDREGKPLYGLAMVEDITEFKRNQEESLARQKLESVGTLASGIAHDFNNLLGGVLSLAELALGECDSGSYPKQELRAIRQVALRGSAIVGQLMTYAGKERESFEPLDVSLIVNEMTELLKVSISKLARLETKLGEDLPTVRGSAAQVQQIVLNLVTNASEAIGDGDGLIRVTTSHLRVGERPGRANSDRFAEGDYLKLEVADTGCGMSVETQARIFDPFFTTKSAGHGLGLAVVHGIVRGLRGAIHVASVLGKGTSFQILLPCHVTKAGASGAAMSEVAGPTRLLQDKSILVVEDEDNLRRAVAKMLRKAGFLVLEASDGSAAIELLREKGTHIGVLLLDLTIPGRSSNEVVAEALRTRRNIRIILTSAYGREMVTSAVSEARDYAFIRKPFQLKDLIEIISSGAKAIGKASAN